jgi:hypothetical protein
MRENSQDAAAIGRSVLQRVHKSKRDKDAIADGSSKTVGGACLGSSILDPLRVAER